ncbi:MAG: hypothetical protein NTW19_18060 [Planctomycetota bacterium]|nr:hypothetical protein [Planctomycetota bacterium]
MLTESTPTKPKRASRAVKVAIGCGLAGLVIWWFATADRLASCKLGNGLVMAVFSEWDPDGGSPVYYRVLKGREEIVPKCFIPETRQDQMELVFTSADGPIVALIPKQNPRIVLAMLDVGTCESWPYRVGGENWEGAMERAHVMLRRLNEKYPKADYVLGVETPGY